MIRQKGRKAISLLAKAIIGISSLVFLAIPPSAQAAGAFFYLSPSTGTKAIDSAFSVAIKINTSGAVINAAEGVVNFDSGKIEAVEISQNDSIFNLWTAKPAFDNKAGTITFGGGIPQPGYNGKNGTVISIKFKAKAVGDAQIFFSSGAILASDGLGTNILSSMGSASYSISAKTDAPKEEEDKEAKAADEKSGIEESKVVAADLKNSAGIISASHPDENVWYGEQNVDFKWALPPEAENVAYLFDQSPASEPDTKDLKGLIPSVQFKDAKDGVWYFHLKIKTKSGWSETSHYRIQIDSTPPAPFKITVGQEEAKDLPVLFFKTIDEISGIVRYEVNIGSLEEKAFVVGAGEDSLKVPSLEIGPHTAMVKAIDAAGNEVISTVDFDITPIETPVIKNYSQEIEPSDKFFMSGTAMSEVNLTIYLQKAEGRVITKRTTSDRNGMWYYIDEEGLENGRYVAWVEAENANGLKSEPTSKISFLVTPPVFARIGSTVINYFTILVSLLFMIILIIASVVLLAGLLRKRLKKETFEVEDVLHANIAALKELVDKELAQLAKLESKEEIKKEKTRLKTSLKTKIDSTEKKIMKEIKDVEKLLK